MSKLLINEHPLIVLPSLVSHFGGNYTKAIIVQQIHWMLGLPNSGIEHNGHRWIWKTSDEWSSEVLPWLKPATVAKALRDLEADYFIESTSRIRNKYDATKYYRINYNILDQFGIPNVDEDSDVTQGEYSNVDSSTHSGLDSSTHSSIYTKTTSKNTAQSAESLGFEDAVFQLIQENYVTFFAGIRDHSQIDRKTEPYVTMAETYGWEKFVRAFMAAKADEYRTAAKPEHVEHFIHAKPDAANNAEAAPIVAGENEY